MKNLRKSPSPWVSARSYRTCKVDCRLPSAVSLLYGFGSRNAGKRKVGGKIKFGDATCIDDEKESLQTRYIETSSIRCRVSLGLSSEEQKIASRARRASSSRWITSRAYFAANRCTGNELALSSRREYLRGPYTSTTTHTWCIRMKL